MDPARVDDVYVDALRPELLLLINRVDEGHKTAGNDTESGYAVVNVVSRKHVLSEAILELPPLL
jgi:hypothetical protein